MTTTFLLLTYFFYNFLKSDIPIEEDVLAAYDLVQYYFFTNFLSFKYLFDIQILLRFQLKIEYSFTDLISPIEILHYLQRAEELEEEKKNKERENGISS